MSEQVPLALGGFGPGFVIELLNLLRPIRIGWMARRGLGVVTFSAESEVNSVSRIRIKAGPEYCAEPLRS